MRFLQDRQTLEERRIVLHPGSDQPGRLFGWIQAHSAATHLQVLLDDAAPGESLAEVTFHRVAERDPKCHPLANVPRWGTYRPPFAIDRIVLPPDLESLAADLPEFALDIVRPRSRAALSSAVRGAACIVDPAWVADFGLTWADILRLAARSWLIVDLETACKLLLRAGLREARLVNSESPHGIMSARVDYSDVQTRGFALQDVFPFCTVGPSGSFQMRVLRANRAWQRFADQSAMATLLASETPAADCCGDVFSAAQPVGQGELILTDLPWLVAGKLGPLLAPRLARHALRMHLAAPLADDLQYWNRWDESHIIVRDISEIPRRYRPLECVRWAAAEDGTAHLGLVLRGAEAVAGGRNLIIRTGRMDNHGSHAGLPPEPLIIVMKMLAREVRERTAWAERHLRQIRLIWQFDTAAGQRYAWNYDSADRFASNNVRVLNLRERDSREPGVVPIAHDDGVFGDGSFEYQQGLSMAVRHWIELGGEC